MLQTIHSNRMERLVQALLERLQRPLRDPLASEIILVQNPGMARWLSQQLALAGGIAANLEFPLPASFAWRMQQVWLGQDLDLGTYDKQSLRWQLMAILPALLPQPQFLGLRQYLDVADEEIRRYQLCGRIADLFDQYLVYRPQMLLDWQQGSLPSQADAAWQALLWRALVARTPGEHRAALYQRFLQQASAAPAELIREKLPERVSVFGLSALAPVYLKVLEVLAEHAEVCLYLLNPCAEYWADIQDDKGQARRRARWRRQGQQDQSALLDVGNPLLASMGQVGQALLDQLLEAGAAEAQLFAEPAGANLLQQLQGDILQLQDRSSGLLAERSLIDPADRSVQIHACHSPMREVQVLHDQLRACFDELDDLEPRQLVVMAPDIASYAPWIEAVFGNASGERHIPWSIADLPPLDAPLLRGLEQLLRLPESRFEASAVLSLLELPALAARFGIDGAGLERIRRWVQETAIRWGKDGQMRAELGLPATQANSWEAGLQQLFFGYALAPQGQLYEGVLAYADIEGAEAEWLGNLAELLRQLDHWRRELARPLPAQAWVERINRLLAAFFRPNPDEAELLQRVRNALVDLAQRCQQSGFDQPLSLHLIRAELNQALASSQGAQRFMVGGVTFCNMVPMRSIPFRVICLLGMNDGQFPRRDDPLGFDLMAQLPLASDRSRRLDDRYLFLEALLSARERLYISYVGNSQRDNSPRNPSVLVSELIDYLQRGWRL
ncbi:MAG: exodeoxyribonuclease V subunit gamma, partial [Gammaproteobacteria bacterium]|nr:exodeoxyribonuclease V subunit gamma [Gammaproteobacteria bacterium]